MNKMKLIGLLFVIGCFCLVSCEKQCDGNFGDKSVKPTLTLSPELTSTTVEGKSCPLVIENEGDVTSPSGLQYHLTEMTANFTYEEDTYELRIESNALWKAPASTVDAGRLPWFENKNPLTNLPLYSGGGNGKLTLVVPANNKATARKTLQTQTIYTADSTIMYKIVFGQYGTNGN